jgi:hypothetical protein
MIATRRRMRPTSTYFTRLEQHLVGATVEKWAASEETAIWIVVTGAIKDTQSERPTIFTKNVVGLKGEIPTSKDGDVGLLSMWLHLYHGNIKDDLSHLNGEDFRKKACWKPVTHYAWRVVFIGIIYATRNSTNKGMAYGHQKRHE